MIESRPGQAPASRSFRSHWGPPPAGATIAEVRAWIMAKADEDRARALAEPEKRSRP